MREYLVLTESGSEHCRVEYFDKNGDLNHVDTMMLQTGNINFRKGKLNGKGTLIYKEGHFDLEFRNNQLVSWKYFNRKGEELLSDDNLSY